MEGLLSRLKITHRLFAARCVAAIIDRGRLLPRRYCPKPRLCLRCLRVKHNAPDYWSAPVTEPHIVVVLIPKIRTTAFSCRDKNKLIRRTRLTASVLSFPDANEHEYCRPLLWPEGRVALVYKADRASGIERVGVENLLVLLATRAAGRLFTGSCDNPDRWSVGAGSETKESGGTGRTSGTWRTSGT